MSIRAKLARSGKQSEDSLPRSSVAAGRVCRTALCVGISAILAGCGGKDRPRVSVVAISGSDTMVNLAQIWAEEYRKKVASVSVEVSGGGSGVGIRDLIQGVVQAADCSREMEPAERSQIADRSGKEPVETVVGFDGIAIYVHKDNPLNAIALDQLAGIFAEDGAIERWSQLGVDMAAINVPDKIVRVSRQNSSGTYLYFREHVLDKRDFKPGSCDMSGSKDVVELVARTKSAIGYSGMGYATKDVKMLRIRTPGSPEGLDPSLENVTRKTYPLSRPLYMCTIGPPEGEMKKYLEWILSPEGQHIVEQAGYVPVSAGR